MENPEPKDPKKDEIQTPDSSDLTSPTDAIPPVDAMASETTPATEIPTEPSFAATTSTTSASGVVVGGPKKSKKPLVILLILLLLIGGGAAAWWFKLRPKPSSNNQANNLPVKQATPEQNLFFQLDSKIIKYNQKDKTTVALTANLPKGARVLDFIKDDQPSWRTVYVVYGNDDKQKDKIYFLKNDSQPELLVETDEVMLDVVASAQYATAVYNTIASFENNNSTNKTFLVKSGQQPQLLYESEKFTNTKVTGIRSSLYTVKDLSPAADKVLFNKHSCFQCDGPPLADAFELDIKTKQPTIVYQSKEPGRVLYNRFTGGTDGYLVFEEPGGYLGLPDGGYKGTVSKVAKPGATAEVKFKAAEKTWASVQFSTAGQQMGYLGVELIDDFDAGTTKGGGIFAYGPATAAELKKVNIEGLPLDSFIVNGISNFQGDCFGVSLIERLDANTSGQSQSAEIGSVCRSKKGGDIYTYHKIDTANLSPSDGYYPTVSILEWL